MLLWSGNENDIKLVEFLYELGATVFSDNDIYLDYPDQKIMFRWAFKTKKIHRKFYRNNINKVVPINNDLFYVALVKGEVISFLEYVRGK